MYVTFSCLCYKPDFYVESEINYIRLNIKEYVIYHMVGPYYQLVTISANISKVLLVT